jgi:hypothetical protein
MNMEITDTKIAIGAIVLIELSIATIGYLSGNPIDSGIVGMGLTAVAGLAGFDMKTKE